MNRPIRVLVVDDSAFTRYVLKKHLKKDPEIRVVGEASNGQDALLQIADLKPDVVTLDVEMPHLDGLSTLQRIMAENPTPVIMLSALTQRSSRTTIQALMTGAIDFVAKPSATTDIHTVTEDLIARIKMAARANPPEPPKQAVEKSDSQDNDKVAPRSLEQQDSLIIIGTSTGGPGALRQVLPPLAADLPAGLVIVQHMPALFTAAMAKRLNDEMDLTVQEARQGDYPMRGLALLAPGNFHLRFGKRGQVLLDQESRHKGVRPSADITMESAVQYYGKRTIGIILTGMGNDGTDGARYIKEAGGFVMAEHQSTCLIYGMPRSVIEAGLADRIVPLPDMAGALMKLVKR